MTDTLYNQFHGKLESDFKDVELSDDEFIDEEIINDVIDEEQNDVIDEEIINDVIDEDEIIDQDEQIIDEVADEIKNTKIEYIDQEIFENYNIPQRNEYVLYPDLIEQIDNRIESNQPIYIHPITINECDEHLYVNGKKQIKYQITMYSILIDGRKVELIIENVPLYIDIEINNKYCTEPHTFRYFIEKLIGHVQSNKIIKDEIVQMYPFNGFTKTKINYLRLYFECSQSRSDVLRELSKHNLTTASDENKLYYASYIRRHKLNSCGWNIISNYTCIKSNNKKTSYKILINYSDINAISDKQIDEKESKHKIPLFSKNQTLVMSYDIETHAHNNTGEAPDPQNYLSYDIFMIGITFHWYYENTPFKQICLTTKPSKGRKDRDTVFCSSERDLLYAFLNIFESMAPDVLIHFNGGRFDTPCMYNKFKQHELLMQAKKMLSCKIKYNDKEDSLGAAYDYNGKFNSLIYEEKMKISANETANIWRFNIEGVIEIDVMAIMRQLNSKEQIGRYHSLNLFLKLYKLDSKDVMDYKYMDKIYTDVTSPNNMQLMDLVCKYCVIDALRCQQLMCKATIINDIRELCATTYVSIYEGVYRANGMKVRNLLAAQAHARNIAFSHITKPLNDLDKGKYPGAKVFYPKRGWHCDMPITGLDFSSLYPSLIMTYNLSPEMLVRTENEKNELEQQGYSLHKISFPFNDIQRTGWFVRHNNVTTINGKRKNIFTQEISDCLPNEQMGLFPSVLKQLFDDRKIYKGKAKIYLKRKEEIETEASTKFQSHEEITQYLANNEEFNEVSFMAGKLTSKEKGKKVVMNTFYGESGNKLSPIREILVAGGTTFMGRYCLQLVADYVQSLGCKLIYGDTDSTYITCPIECYSEIDQLYKNQSLNKLDYYTQKIKITMEKMKDIRNSVNQMLIKDNGTEYLSMAYEEVLFPSQFNGKKMYSGIEHKDLVNFYPEHYFKRGGEYSKGGRSQLLYKICDMYMKERYHPNNWDNDTLTIVTNLIKHIYEYSWDLSYFSKKSKYKPHKKNISVHNFVKRMNDSRILYADDPEKLSLFPIIEPGDTITTLVIKPTILHEINGNKRKISIGDRMEYPEVYNYYNNKSPDSMKIDLRYYLDSGIINTFARFICHYPQFQPQPHELPRIIITNDIDADNNTIDDFIDTYSCTRAEKYLIELCNQLDGINTDVIKKQNNLYKQFYKKTIKHTININKEKIGQEKMFLIDSNNLNLNNNDKINNYYDNIYNEILSYAETHYKDKWGPYIIKYLLEYNKNKQQKYTIHTIKSIYKNSKTNILTKQINNLLNDIESIKSKIKSEIRNIIPIIINYGTKIDKYIMDLRNLDTISNVTSYDEIITYDDINTVLNYTDEQISHINILYSLYTKLKIHVILLIKARDFYQYIDYYISEYKPDNTELSNVILTAQFEPIPPIDNYT